MEGDISSDLDMNVVLEEVIFVHGVCQLSKL